MCQYNEKYFAYKCVCINIYFCYGFVVFVKSVLFLLD